MKKLSIIISHFKSWEWTSVCLWHFRKYPPPVPHEIIVINNSPIGDHSISVLTQTALGDGVKVYPGRQDFPSHGMGYDVAYQQSSGDWIFCSETDSFPIHEDWFLEYLKHSSHAALIGPIVAQSSGPYLHPAGALYKRELIESAIQWQKEHSNWLFIPGAAKVLGLSDEAFHVVAEESWLEGQDLPDDFRKALELWESVGPFQEMRAFRDDSFQTYGQRTEAPLDPIGDQKTFLRIGLEAGQWLHWYAKWEGFPIHEAQTHLMWIEGLEGQQAAFSTVFGRFFHAWGGTVYSGPNDYDQRAKAHKANQKSEWFNRLPEDLRNQVIQLKSQYSS